MARIAVGGWHHETNTFAPLKADYAAFEVAGSWPGLTRGEALFGDVDGINLPMTGSIDYLREHGHELVPLLWCAAIPSAHVTEHAYERIGAMMLEDLAAAGPLDGVMLDLHGAMVTEHLEDGEGELLRRMREVVGTDLPIAVALDLHANMTDAMLEHADAMDIYRTYPHIDMAQTGRRAAAHLHRLLESGERWYGALARTDFLIPLNWGCTFEGPARTIYEQLPERIGGDVLALSFACGFPLADIADVGPAALAYASSPAAAREAADALAAEVASREAEFAGRIYSAEEAVEEARRLSAGASRPVVIADTQDNPGGGGPGDTVGMLRALIDGGASGAVFGAVIDGAFARAAHACGVGGRFEGSLGEKSKLPGHSPLDAEFEVLALGDGRFTCTGPMFEGSRAALGPMALVEIGGVKVVVASAGMQAADQAIFRHLGVEPAAQPVLALKSSVHFRADFQPIAEAVLVAAAPGPVYADPGLLEFKRIRPGVRLRPRSIDND